MNEAINFDTKGRIMKFDDKGRRGEPTVDWIGC